MKVRYATVDMYFHITQVMFDYYISIMLRKNIQNKDSNALLEAFSLLLYTIYITLNKNTLIFLGLAFMK